MEPFGILASFVLMLTDLRIILNVNLFQLSDERGDKVLGPLHMEHFDRSANQREAILDDVWLGQRRSQSHERKQVLEAAFFSKDVYKLDEAR